MARQAGLAYVHSVILCNANCAELGVGRRTAARLYTTNTRAPLQPCRPAGSKCGPGQRGQGQGESALEAVQVRDASASAFEHVVVEIVR